LIDRSLACGEATKASRRTELRDTTDHKKKKRKDKEKGLFVQRHKIHAALGTHKHPANNQTGEEISQEMERKAGTGTKGAIRREEATRGGSENIIPAAEVVRRKDRKRTRLGQHSPDLY